MTEISPPLPPTPPLDPRRRLRELLAIPERDRSDEQWDEIVELEISLAPGNRLDSPDTNVRRTGPAPSGERNKSGGDRRPNGDRGGDRGGDRNRSPGGPRPSGDRQRNGPPRSGGDRPRNGPPRNPDAPPGAEPQAGGTPGEPGVPARKPFKKFHKRPPKANTPE
jgi:hypothetical protein